MNNLGLLCNIKSKIICIFGYTILIIAIPCCSPKTTNTNDAINLSTIKFTQISTGLMSSCALTTSGSIYCFGHGIYGELGNGKNYNSNIPVKVKTPAQIKNFIQVASGSYNSCAISNKQNIYCWGNGQHGQIGNGSNFNTNLPTLIKNPNGIKFIHVTVGNLHACGLDQSGRVYCWGDGGHGELGNGTDLNSNLPIQVKMPHGITFTTITAGITNSCALSSKGTIYCWGDNSYNKLGNQIYSGTNIPTAIELSPTIHFTLLSTGSYGSCALSSTHKLYCFGYGKTGIMSNGNKHSINNLPTLVNMPQHITFTSISDGGINVCALTNHGSIYCWGYGTNGQIGNNDSNGLDVPTAIKILPGIIFKQISSNDFNSCALTNNGLIYCWGYGVDGEIGNGANNSVNRPTLVTQPQ